MTVEPASPPPRPARRSSIVVPHKLNWQKRVTASFAYYLMRLVAATLRYEWNYHPAVFERQSSPAIFCIWHNRLAIALTIYRDYVRRRRGPYQMAAMVSASKDGAIVARILEHFHVVPVRGSSSRRGPQALLEMTTWAERGYDLSFTPDGPRGPRYQVQDGVIYLAQLTGRPVIPVSCYTHWKKCAPSWDGFQIPLPLSRVEVRLGEPMHLSRAATDRDREAFRQQLEQTLKQLGRD